MLKAVKGSVEFYTAELIGRLVNRCANIDRLMVD
jgi:hypothetical protein